MWPPFLTHMNHITTIFGDMLKDNVYVRNPYSEESLMADIWNVMYEISSSQLWHVTNNACESMKIV